VAAAFDARDLQDIYGTMEALRSRLQAES
jgi:hypothetical protein